MNTGNTDSCRFVRITRITLRRTLSCLAFLVVSQCAVAQSNVDYDLSSVIDKFEDVAKRIDFDRKRFTERDHWGDWDKISALDFCGSLAATLTWNVPAKLSVDFGGGLSLDAAFKKSLDLLLKIDSGVSAKVAGSLYGTGYLFGCVNLKPWLLTAWYRYYERTAPPLEAFTYAEYAGTGTPTRDVLTTLSSAFDSDGQLANLDGDTKMFLDTAMKVVFGENGSPEDLESTPIYQHYVSPISDFFETIVDGAVGGADAVLGSGAINALKYAFSDVTRLQTPTDIVSTFETISGRVQDVLPVELHLGTLADSMRNIAIEDFDPCSLSDSQLYEATHLPEIIANGLEEFCGGVEQYANVTLDAINDFVTALPDNLAEAKKLRDDVGSIMNSSYMGPANLIQNEVLPKFSTAYNQFLELIDIIRNAIPNL